MSLPQDLADFSFWSEYPDEQVIESAQLLADAEHAFAQEVLLLVAQGQTTWNAQHMAEVSHGRARHYARALNEIALARLKRA